MASNEIVHKIRTGEIDINNQELFFSILIKGLMLELNKDIKIRNIEVPHIITHTGSDALYLERKGFDITKEPYEVSNEDYIYNVVPRCALTPGSLDVVADQLTNPYSIGALQYDSGEEVWTLKGEFRRVPIKLGVELKYFTDSYRDMLELVQQTITKLSFIRTYNVTYMGQLIKCSYKIPDNFGEEHTTDLDGTSTDGKDHTLTMSLEVESNIPVWMPSTIMPADSYIVHTKANVIVKDEIN